MKKLTAFDKKKLLEQARRSLVKSATLTFRATRMAMKALGDEKGAGWLMSESVKIMKDKKRVG